ncbi:MAG TPA: serine/threonine-protein kinase [Planctomycetota bacterium]|nr:serine/threonine-protein kinase [Planctomycetota bacterium]
MQKDQPLDPEISTEAGRRIEEHDFDALDVLCVKHRESATQIRALEESYWTDRLDAAVDPSHVLGEMLIGRLVVNRYRIRRCLGEGSSGVVFEALDVRLGRAVAFKVLKHPFPGRADCDRFLKETRALVKSHHRGIATIYDVGSTLFGLPFYVMDLVEGETLSAVLERVKGRRPEELLRRHLRANAGGENSATDESERAIGRGADAGQGYVFELVRLVAKVADALDHAHGIGVIHRDVKPGNILIGANGEPLIVDFGLAVGAGLGLSTSGDRHAGTPMYMAPEQVRGERSSIGPWTDVYALGVTLYHALALRPPYDDQGTAVFLKVLEGGAKPLRQFNPAVPVELERVVAKAMAVQPEKRYGSAGSLHDDLVNVVARRPVSARRDVPWPTIVRRLRATLVYVCLAWASFDLAFVHDGLALSARMLVGAATELVDSLSALFARGAEDEAQAAEGPARPDPADGRF